MNRLQKIAWYQLAVILIVLALTATVVGGIAYRKGIENAHSGLVTLILLIFVHLDRMFFPVEAGKIIYDERDEMIKKKAVVTAYTVFWIAFILACIIPLFILGPNSTIHISVLPAMVFGAAILVRVVWSAAVLVQYGRGVKGEKS